MFKYMNKGHDERTTEALFSYEEHGMPSKLYLNYCHKLTITFNRNDDYQTALQSPLNCQLCSQITFCSPYRTAD